MSFHDAYALASILQGALADALNFTAFALLCRPLALLSSLCALVFPGETFRLLAGAYVSSSLGAGLFNNIIGILSVGSVVGLLFSLFGAAFPEVVRKAGRALPLYLLLRVLLAIDAALQLAAFSSLHALELASDARFVALLGLSLVLALSSCGSPPRRSSLFSSRRVTWALLAAACALAASAHAWLDLAAISARIEASVLCAPLLAQLRDFLRDFLARYRPRRRVS